HTSFEGTCTGATQSRLRNYDAADDDRAVQRIELGRLAHAAGREHVHRLRHLARREAAQRSSPADRADAELEVLRRRLEASRLVGAEAVLAGEHDGERPART